MGVVRTAFMLAVSWFCAESALSEQVSESDKVALSNAMVADERVRYKLDSWKLFELVRAENFVVLKAQLVETERQFEQNPVYEWAFLKAYEDFQTMEWDQYEEMIKRLGRWVDADQSYVSYAARGFFITGWAQRYRGTRIIKDTDPDRLARARGLWRMALADLQKSIELNPGLLPAYSELIKTYNNLGMDPLADELLATAIVRVPQSYYIRQAALLYKQPKWGGDFSEGQRIVGEAQKYGELNPRLWNLRGNMFAIRGKHCRKDLDCAIEHYNQALAYGDKTGWITDLAYYYYKKGDYAMSAKTMQRLRPYTTSIDRLDGMIAGLTKWDHASRAPLLLREEPSKALHKEYRVLTHADFDLGW